MSAAILGIGTATPPSVSQTTVAAMGEALCCDEPKQASFLQRVFERSGVEARGSVLVSGDPELAAGELVKFYPPRTGRDDRGPTTSRRMQRYAQHAPPLAITAAREALDSGRTTSQQITHLITVSCTGFFSPGLDAALIEALDLSPQVQRQHIGFMGCHAAFNALASARDIVRSLPSARVLVVCVELCTLHFSYGWDAQRVVANSLFADGAAAAVVGDDRDGWAIERTASRLLPHSRAAMTWVIADHGFEMTLAPEVPLLVETHLAGWCDSWLAAPPTDVEHFAIHPGGPKVITAVGRALGVCETKLRPSRELLRTRGNMSSTTVLFLLRDLLAADTSGRCVALGFGPGLVMEGMLLRRG